MPQHHAFACSRGLLRAESASHKVQAAEFTGRARWGISSTGLTPTARVAEGSFGDAQFATGTKEGRPYARSSHAAATATGTTARRRVGALLGRR